MLHPSRKAEMSRGLMLPSTRLSGHKESSLLSDLVGFAPSIDAVPHCLGQGSERQAENQWSDILGRLLVLSAGWPGSKARFPGLAVWGVCPGSWSSLPSPTCSPSKLASILVNSGSPPGPPARLVSPQGETGTRYNLLSFTKKEGPTCIHPW